MILAVLLAYLAVLAGIGIACRRRNRSLDDFILGGRRLGPWVTAVSAEASDMSAWLLVGLPATAYALGFSIVWTAIGCACGTFFNWFVIAPRLRRLAGRTAAMTVPDLLEARLGAGRLRLLRLLSVAVILTFYASYIAAQFIAAGTVAEETLRDVATPWGPVTYEQGLVVGAGVIILYTSLGGFLAVAYTDLVQGIMMVLAVVVLPVAAIARAGGIEPILLSFADARGAAALGVTGGEAGPGLLLGIVVGGLAWGLGYPGQPHILARFMAIRDPRALRRSFLISMIWVLIALYGAMLVGICGVATVGSDLAKADQVMPKMALTVLPPWLAGIVIAAALAAMMSTVDSQIIVAASAVAEDVLVKTFRCRPSDRISVLIGRIVAVALGGAGVAIAWGRENVFDQVFDAWSGLAAGLGPAVILTVLWRGTTRAGVVAGMVAGVGINELWARLSDPLGWLCMPAGWRAMPWPGLADAVDAPLLASWPNGLVPAFAASLAAIVAVSLAIRPLRPAAGRLDTEGGEGE